MICLWGRVLLWIVQMGFRSIAGLPLILQLEWLMLRGLVSPKETLTRPLQRLRKEHICLSMGAEGSQSSVLFDFLLMNLH